MTAPKSDDRQAGDPLWAQYEQSIQTMLAALDANATVLHNARVPGRLSASLRQVDVWVTGNIVGQSISIAVECKRTSRPITVETIDSFVGKLLDIGAERGIMYSYAGFSSSATTRAYAASSPSLMPIALQTPQIVLANRGVPGYPADLLVQEMPPRWADELDEFSYMDFLKGGNAFKWH